MRKWISSFVLFPNLYCFLLEKSHEVNQESSPLTERWRTNTVDWGHYSMYISKEKFPRKESYLIVFLVPVFPDIWWERKRERDDQFAEQILENIWGLFWFLSKGTCASPSSSIMHSFLCFWFQFWLLQATVSTHIYSLSITLISCEETPCCLASFWKDFYSINLALAWPQFCHPKLWPFPYPHVGNDRKDCVLETLKYQCPFLTTSAVGYVLNGYSF